MTEKCIDQNKIAFNISFVLPCPVEARKTRTTFGGMFGISYPRKCPDKIAFTGRCPPLIVAILNEHPLCLGVPEIKLALPFSHQENLMSENKKIKLSKPHVCVKLHQHEYVNDSLGHGSTVAKDALNRI